MNGSGGTTQTHSVPVASQAFLWLAHNLLVRSFSDLNPKDSDVRKATESSLYTPDLTSTPHAAIRAFHLTQFLTYSIRSNCATIQSTRSQPNMFNLLRAVLKVQYNQQIGANLHWLDDGNPHIYNNSTFSLKHSLG
jgi:hypothetical protein